MPTHILAGLGTASSSYSPPITQSAQTVTVHSATTFVPPVPCADAPTRLLISSQVNGTFVTQCLGSVTEPNHHGTLKWSDGTTSAFNVNTFTAERVEGHIVGHAEGTIINGHYSGATINLLPLRLANQTAACLAGSSVSGGTGAEVVVVTAP
ncbi:hypothetical protein ACWCPI_37470 [Streptomyces sp. NPDC001920]